MEHVENICNLLDNISTISKSYEVLARSTGENFNIFSILKMEADENATHSAFIAEIININGSHKYGSRFLELFFDYFEIKDYDFNFEKYDTITEYSIGAISSDFENGGRIDIFIRDDRENVIMIENKVYAGEQNKQLIRYKNAFPNGKLFFLTLEGKESDSKEIKEIESKNHGYYKSISYANDIINWMELCRKEAIDTPMLREIISQYVYLLKKLTNQNANKEMSTEVISRILSNKSNFNAYKSLIGVQNELVRTILKEEFLDVVQEIATENGMDFKIDDNFLSGDIYRGFRLDNKSFKAMNLCLRFDFEGRDFKHPLFGFAFLNPNIVQDFDYSEIIKKFDCVLPNSESNNNFARYKMYRGEDWKNLNKLQDMKFGNFKTDLRNKIQNLIKIV